MTNDKPKFTPGPWRIEKSEYPDGSGYFYLKAKSEIIGGDCLIFQGVKTNMANAFLMAAAPEMYANEEKNLKSLRTLLHFVEMITKTCDMTPVMRITALSGIVDTKERIETTEKLLARCQGEEQ